MTPRALFHTSQLRVQPVWWFPYNSSPFLSFFFSFFLIQLNPALWIVSISNPVKSLTCLFFFFQACIQVRLNVPGAFQSNSAKSDFLFIYFSLVLVWTVNFHFFLNYSVKEKLLCSGCGSTALGLCFCHSFLIRSCPGQDLDSGISV